MVSPLEKLSTKSNDEVLSEVVCCNTTDGKWTLRLIGRESVDWRSDEYITVVDMSCNNNGELTEHTCGGSIRLPAKR